MYSWITHLRKFKSGSIAVIDRSRSKFNRSQSNPIEVNRSQSKWSIESIEVNQPRKKCKSSSGFDWFDQSLRLASIVSTNHFDRLRLTTNDSTIEFFDWHPLDIRISSLQNDSENSVRMNVFSSWWEFGRSLKGSCHAKRNFYLR